MFGPNPHRIHERNPGDVARAHRRHFRRDPASESESNKHDLVLIEVELGDECLKRDRKVARVRQPLPVFGIAAVESGEPRHVYRKALSEQVEELLAFWHAVIAMQDQNGLAFTQTLVQDSPPAYRDLSFVPDGARRRAGCFTWSRRCH